MKIVALLVVVLAFLACANAAASICDTYTASGQTNADWLTGVVKAVFGEITAANTPTLPYFNGSIGENQDGEHVDFLTNSTALNTLAGNLVAFFGSSGALDCTDGTTGTYQGEDMATVHKNNQINRASWEYFNQQLTAVAQAAGFSHNDYSTLSTVLESFRSEICTEADCFQSPYTITVGQQGNFFNPAAGYTFPVGAMIEWVWYGSVGHSVTQSNSTDGTNVCNPATNGFNSGVHTSPYSFNQTFSQAGTYYFYCTVPGHCSQTGMWGQITISAGSSSTASSTSGSTSSSTTRTTTATTNLAGTTRTTRVSAAGSVFASAAAVLVLLFALVL